MDADVARILAKGLKAHKRKGAATFGSAKKARVEETDPAAFCPDRPEPVLRHTFNRECFPVCVTVWGNLTSERRSCLLSL